MNPEQAKEQGQQDREWASVDAFSLVAAANETTRELSPEERRKFAPLIESSRRLELQQRVLAGGTQIPSPV